MAEFFFGGRTQAKRNENARLEELHQAEEDKQTQELIDQAKFEHRLGRLRPHLGLARMRSELGVSQEKMAQICGVTRRTYQFYEGGEKAIPSNVLCRLAATYEFDMHELFAGKPHSNNLHVHARTAEVTAAVVLHLIDNFPLMEMDEMQRIAMEFARTHRGAGRLSTADLIESIHIVTGEKYVEREKSYFEVTGELSSDYMEEDT